MPLPDAPADLPWVDLFINWSVAFPNWIMPQLDKMAAMGMNAVRLIGAADGVLAGFYTQSAYNAAVNQLLAACTTRNMALVKTLMGMPATSANMTSTGSRSALVPAGQTGYTRFGQPALQGLMDIVYGACYAPNAASMAWIEAGLQECPYNDIGLSIALAGHAKGLGNIPVVISFAQLTNPPLAGLTAAQVDGIALHYYPAGATDLQTVSDAISNAAKGYSAAGLPFLIEECGVGGATAQQSFFHSITQAAFAHPDCVGVLAWGPYGTQLAGGYQTLAAPFSLATPPAYTALTPTAWADTAGSIEQAATGQMNRNLTYNFTTPSQASGTIAQTATTGNVTTPSIIGYVVRSVFRKATTVKHVGTLALSAATQLSLVAIDASTSAQTVIAGPLSVAPGSSQAFSLSGSIPANLNGVTISLVAAGTGTVSGNTVLTVGNYVPMRLALMPGGRAFAAPGGGVYGI